MNPPTTNFHLLRFTTSLRRTFAALLIASLTAWADPGPDNENAAEQMQKVFTAFARNDEAAGRKLAQEFLDLKGGVVSPQQAQTVQLLLRITATPTLKDESPDEAKARAEAIKVAGDLKGVLAQLEKIEATARTMPKTGFSAGGPTHQRWIQMGEDRGRLWEQRDKLTKRQGELVAEYNTAHTARMGSVEAEVLEIAGRLAEQSDFVGATALCNTYVRKNPSAQNVARKGQELFAHQEGKSRGQSPALVPAVPSNDKTYALLDDLEKAIKAWWQYKKEKNEVEATIQSDLIEKLCRNPAWLNECMRFGPVGDDVTSYFKAPEKALAALAKYRTDYPAIRAEHDKKHALEAAIAARRKEEADKESAERRRVEEGKAKATAPQREAQMKKEAEAEAGRMEAKKKPIRSLEDAVSVVNGKLFGGNAEYKVGKELVSLGGVTPKNTTLYPVRFENGRDAYFFKDEFDEWSFYEKGTRNINRIKNFQ